ncbi:hypothetical protein A2926_04520 [Candidatus Giovannonibacteria bacterium RIFCSPLOWO2_01_FULL_44_40]|uniref:General secretion pathway GspH domain-containing protein n=1 Tax=Candidatus Giovannonibacteria bacterium RIFCSPHIGHO2_01_FULL_45_23 TaxID=1798325 RepID=A0A1F5VI43_9BACT|nr:MAG: hypothetical protein A2834_02965 [Candidatus Giovannonibacteria bacterium RIFCSPHIGHO2_01_FULL_45_23]OGF75593.1 MAG: hypothetical protein A3C77_00825 [Candidatus Giovannonibacteria bacterium RIFCSPHIGHO2_02_FULL_45_13]OGF80100.1 MAG: hypothetical protein A2926_04520 [Candidatus Giovannonibacteria bacterium RIFCSPLOWO2_01_FULL_44_40]
MKNVKWKMENGGFTMLEMLISFFIVAIIATILFVAFGAFRESNDLQSAQETIIGILRDARSRSVGSQDKKTYGVHFEATKAVLFKGSVYSASDSANEAYILPTLVKISSITLSGGAVDTVFSILGGTTTASGTVTISSQRDQSKTRTITIFSTGGIQ